MVSELPARETPELEARGLEYRYAGGGFHLRPLDARFAPGGFAVVLGSNGSGKSTLVRLLGGLLPPRAGEVRLGGRALERVARLERSRTVAFLAQDEPRRVPFTAFETVMMGRYPFQGRWPFDSARDLEVARAAMQRADVTHLRERLVPELSGGERQRVYLARALAQEPRILLLDEPAASLDLAHQVELYEFLRELNREEGITVVAVSHEINLATRYCDQVLLLKAGELHASGSPAELLTAEQLSRTFDVDVRELSDEASGRPVFLPRGPRR